MKQLVILLFLFTFMGCGLPAAQYFVSLKGVDTDRDRQIQIDRHTYEDDWLKTTWTFNRRSVSLDMKNKTDSTVRILWDHAVYVDNEGYSQRVVHSNIRFIESGNAHQVPSTIVKKSKLSDIIVPVNKIYWDGGWKQHVLIKPWLATKKKPLEVEVKKNVGKTMQLLIPIEIHGQTHEYLFQFEITGYHIKREPGLSTDLIGKG